MPAKVHCGGLFLGDTIQEKTRTLLGWNDEVIFHYHILFNVRFGRERDKKYWCIFT